MRAILIGKAANDVDATVDGDRLLVEPAALPDTLGWELKPEGLCRGDVCVPVRDTEALVTGGLVDLGAVAVALGRPIVVDAGAGFAAVALDEEARRRALMSLSAPPFTLPDLDGRPRSLDEWLGDKKLLVAFASW